MVPRNTSYHEPQLYMIISTEEEVIVETPPSSACTIKRLLEAFMSLEVSNENFGDR
jgi:hypothetical protein